VEYDFLNGDAGQKALWEEAVSHLLHLPSIAISEKVVVEFVDALPSGHTDLALTTWTYGTSEARTEVRSDAIDFGRSKAALEAEAAAYGLSYSVEKFYMETAIHELGHALYAALPEERRVALARMFGASDDTPAQLQPSHQPWQDHAAEGIAETFKEAFLPRRFRVFPNRTNKKIPYHRFPEFRALWRQAIPEVIRGGAPLEEGEEEVPEYDVDIFKQGGYRKTTREEHVDFLIGDGGLWDTRLEEVYTGKPPELTGSVLSSECRWAGWVKNGTVLKWELPLSLAPFEQDGTGVHIEVFRPEVGTVFFDGFWLRADGSPGGFTLIGDAAGFPPPPTTISDSVVVNLTNFGSKERVCHGVIYRWVEIAAIVELDLGPHVLSEHVALREALLYPWLGPFPFVQTACTSGGEPGPPIDVPPPAVLSGGSLGGSIPHKRPIVGNTN
jgi:hypothetical protein